MSHSRLSQRNTELAREGRFIPLYRQTVHPATHTHQFVVAATISNNVVLEITSFLRRNLTATTTKISRNTEAPRVLLLLGHIASECQDWNTDQDLVAVNGQLYTTVKEAHGRHRLHHVLEIRTIGAHYQENDISKTYILLPGQYGDQQVAAHDGLAHSTIQAEAIVKAPYRHTSDLLSAEKVLHKALSGHLVNLQHTGDRRYLTHWQVARLSYIVCPANDGVVRSKLRKWVVIKGHIAVEAVVKGNIRTFDNLLSVNVFERVDYQNVLRGKKILLFDGADANGRLTPTQDTQQIFANKYTGDQKDDSIFLDSIKSVTVFYTRGTELAPFTVVTWHNET